MDPLDIGAISESKLKEETKIEQLSPQLDKNVARFWNRFQRQNDVTLLPENMRKSIFKINSKSEIEYGSTKSVSLTMPALDNDPFESKEPSSLSINKEKADITETMIHQM